MNGVGIVFLATVARVTALAIFGVALALILKRRGPSAVALATITTLSAVVAVTALSLSPWPRFWSFEMAKMPVRVEKSAEPANVVETDAVAKVAKIEARPVATGMAFSELIRMFIAELRSQPLPDAADERDPWRWPAWVAAALIAAAAMGLARLALALRAVGLLRRRSVTVTDVALRDEVDLLRAEIGCLQGIEIRETSDLTTPATVGWRRPVLLVPTDWTCWQPDERRAALAHELAHVQGGDYLSGLWAQACLSFHLYHPLAHWLVARFRLEQELAADAAAARFSGGSRAYLEALARLALKRSGPLEPSPGAGLWPARPFLPTRGMFLRRMEMLRDPNSAPRNSQPLRPIGRAMTVATLGAAALIVAGLRGPLQAQQDPPAAKEGESKVTTRPVAPTPTQVERAAAQQAKSMKNMRHLALAMHGYLSANNIFPQAVLHDKPGNVPYSWRIAILPYLNEQALYDEYDFSEPWDGPKNKKLLAKIPAVYQHSTEMGKNFNASYFVPKGDLTIFPSDGPGIPIDNILDGTSATILTVEAKLDIPWTKPEDFPVDIDLNKPKQPAPKIPTFDPNRILVCLADGSIRSLPATIDSQSLRALFTKAGGEVINWNSIDNPTRPANAPQAVPAPRRR